MASVPAPQELRGHLPWLLLAGLSVSETVSWGVLYYAFSVFLLPMEAELGWSRAQTAAAFSLGLLTSAVAAPLVGRWIDRRGPRLLMTLGSCLGVLLVLAWSRVHTLAGLYLVWAGVGLAMAAVLYEPAFAVVTTWFSQERDRALTILTLVAGLASAIFVPLASYLTQQLGWRPALVVLAAVLGGITVPVHFLLPHRPIAKPNGPPDETAHAGTPAAVSLLAALQGRAFWYLAAAFVLSGLATAAMGVHLIPYLGDRGYSAEASAAAVGMMGAMQLPGRLLFAPLRGRVPRAWTTAAVFLLQSVAMAALPTVSTTLGLAVFVVCFGMGNGLMTLARAASVADIFGTTHYGSIAGALASLTTVARAAGPLAAALIYGASGRYEPVFWTLAVSLALAGLAALATESGAVDGVFRRATRPATPGAAPGGPPARPA